MDGLSRAASGFVFVLASFASGACGPGETPPGTTVPASNPAAPVTVPAPTTTTQTAEPVVLIPPRVTADALTLQQLIDEAHVIVLGVVKSIEFTSVRLSEGAASSQMPVRVVTLAVSRAFKGPVTDGATHLVQQSAAESAPLRVGEEVLWYLDEPSELGLTQPLGFYSGDFRVTVADDQRQAVNLRGNAELWEGSLWTGAERIDQAALLNSARALGVSTALEPTLIKMGSSPPSNLLPLDLLLSATVSQVRRPQ